MKYLLQNTKSHTDKIDPLTEMSRLKYLKLTHNTQANLARLDKLSPALTLTSPKPTEITLLLVKFLMLFDKSILETKTLVKEFDELQKNIKSTKKNIKKLNNHFNKIIYTNQNNLTKLILEYENLLKDNSLRLFIENLILKNMGFKTFLLQENSGYFLAIKNESKYLTLNHLTKTTLSKKDFSTYKINRPLDLAMAGLLKIAYFFELNNSPENAISAYKNCLALDSNNGTANYRLALLIQNKDSATANQYLNNALKDIRNSSELIQKIKLALRKRRHQGRLLTGSDLHKI